MARELFFYATIDTFDEIITEFRSCCDGSTEMERELLQQTAITNNLLTKWRAIRGPISGTIAHRTFRMTC